MVRESKDRKRQPESVQQRAERSFGGRGKLEQKML